MLLSKGGLHKDIDMWGIALANSHSKLLVIQI